MKSRPLLMRFILLTAALCGLSGMVQAENWRNPVSQLAQYEQLPPDQRREMRRQMREHWQQMPEEQRQARQARFREDREYRRESLHQLAPEDRQRMREEMRNRRDAGEGRHGREPRGQR